MASGGKIRVGNRTIPVTNLEKVLYPAGRFTKHQVIEYYQAVAPFILPHLRQRPVTLKRFPDGVFGEAFYEKDAPAFTPEWVKTFPVPRQNSTGDPIRYILVNDRATLAWLANLACLELHPFLHQVPLLDRPTAVAFDLDPGEGADIIWCCEVALLLRNLLQQLRLKAFPKVSGSKGLQIYVPLNGTASYESTRTFAEAIATLLARQHSGLIVSEMAKALRRRKVFIDWSQNATHKTTVSVYSLRAKTERPYVSLPVSWSEVEQALADGVGDRLYFNPADALNRIRKTGDLFKPVLSLKQSLPLGFLGDRNSKASIHPSVRPTGTPRRLTEYVERRNFTRTPEPAPVPRAPGSQSSRRRFVVQKHAASHLHYDLRLEMSGVLKSWAVPKGLPVQPGQTVSAFETEDHPVEYINFEGTIPEGQYGGGTVMVWDRGNYNLNEGSFWKGHFSFFLEGTKVKGEWLLDLKEESRGKRKWLLRNNSELPVSISRQKGDRSAVSGLTMEEIRTGKLPVWQGNRQAQLSFVPPMLALLRRELPSGPDWAYEVKWDGYRMQALKSPTVISLLSRNGADYTNKFSSVADALADVGASTFILDGEIVAADAQGRPSFQALQTRSRLPAGFEIQFYVFDVVHLNGRDLRNVPWQDRRAELEKLLNQQHSPILRLSPVLEGDASTVITAVSELGLEGIIAKRRSSVYESGQRSGAWSKLPLKLRQEFVIGGFRPGGNNFDLLLVGYYKEGRLLFAGKVRQGFNRHNRAVVFRRLKPLRSTTCPFKNLPNSRRDHFGETVTAEEMKDYRWLIPESVADVRFTEWTRAGVLRHAEFVAFVDDKRPEDVAWELGT